MKRFKKGEEYSIFEIPEGYIKYFDVIHGNANYLLCNHTFWFSNIVIEDEES